MSCLVRVLPVGEMVDWGTVKVMLKLDASHGLLLKRCEVEWRKGEGRLYIRHKVPFPKNLGLHIFRLVCLNFPAKRFWRGLAGFSSFYATLEMRGCVRDRHRKAGRK